MLQVTYIQIVDYAQWLPIRLTILLNPLLQVGGTNKSDPANLIVSDILLRPGEDLAAIGFVAVVFYLFIDINLGIYRTFKKKQGLYYWCMLLGTWGCVADSIGVVLKNFVPNPEPLWPLYTLFILGGWTIYAPAQLLVLYSRLHLVNQNHKLQRWVLIMIIAIASLIIIPTWSLVWQAYDPYNPRLSALYSPREAIVDRCTQIGYTVAESIISGIYIVSLAKLLSLKSNVRQRRVMTDFIYVVVIAISLDVTTVVLVYLNQTGISHPIQTFSYLLKLKLEFLVLNQLMAVAARGIQKENFAERRYHHPSIFGEKGSSAPSRRTLRWGLEYLPKAPKNDSARELMVPSPVLSKVQRTPGDFGSQITHDHIRVEEWPLKGTVKSHDAKVAGDGAGEEEDDEIGVHMWEKGGKLVKEVPWFRTEGHV